MKKSFLKALFLISLLICFPFSKEGRAEIIGASSVEWLTVSSKIVAVGKITKVERVKGEYAVVYENYTFEPSEVIKGSKMPKAFNFTIRTFSTSPVFGKSWNLNDEIIVFLSEYVLDNELFMKGKLVPTSSQFPLSIAKASDPGKYFISRDFRVLTEKNEILNVSRQANAEQVEYQKKNPAKSIKRVSIEVAMGSKAWESLYAGSTCYLIVPNFMLGGTEKIFP